MGRMGLTGCMGLMGRTDTARFWSASCKLERFRAARLSR